MISIPSYGFVYGARIIRKPIPKSLDITLSLAIWQCSGESRAGTLSSATTRSLVFRQVIDRGRVVELTLLHSCYLGLKRLFPSDASVLLMIGGTNHFFMPSH